MELAKMPEGDIPKKAVGIMRSQCLVTNTT